LGISIINTYYVGMTIYPDYFADVDLAEKGDEIFNVLFGQQLFDQMEKIFSSLNCEYGFVSLLS
jgi:hypothetical protein